MDIDLQAIRQAIMDVLTQKVHAIGNRIDGKAREEAIKEVDYGTYTDRYIYDLGNFWNAMTYVVTQEGEDTLVLRVGSNVKHEPFVLGGKVPSWTPIAPLIAWVQRKNLAWVDKETGQPLSVETMAYMIRSAIKRRGIRPRNVYQEVIKNQEEWIYKELSNMEVSVDFAKV